MEKHILATVFAVEYIQGISDQERARLIGLVVDHIIDWHGFELFSFERTQLIQFLVAHPFNWVAGERPYTYYVVRAKNWLYIHQKAVSRPGSLPDLRRRYTFVWERVQRCTPIR